MSQISDIVALLKESIQDVRTGKMDVAKATAVSKLAQSAVNAANAQTQFAKALKIIPTNSLLLDDETARLPNKRISCTSCVHFNEPEESSACKGCGGQSSVGFENYVQVQA